MQFLRQIKKIIYVEIIIISLRALLSEARLYFGGKTRICKSYQLTSRLSDLLVCQSINYSEQRRYNEYLVPVN